MQFNDDLKYKLHQFFATMSLSQGQLEAIEQSMDLVIDRKISAHRKSIGERIGTVEKDLIELKHELRSAIREVAKDSENADRQFNDKFKIVTTIMQWIIPATIAGIITYLVAK